MLRERDALQETNRRLEHLIAELNQILHGKRSEKLNDDKRQVAFEDLGTAVAEAKTRQDAEATPRTPPRRAARRNRGHLPESLPRVERVIEPGTFPYTARARSLRAQASSFTAARWPIGSAPPPSTSARWSIG
ncbi:Transposase C of IS166 homeodomain-containing protein [Paracoccus homiensis]|uniref:Transposase C of IS166 homeodomain-containing protein n=1 Tax=Paracoccus homiensis TaxID=364199 RepID=A0A1I0D6B6_9RHOB|nr:Transposase C of IS166 homeodomain-containing protein [Paracoccus homiensis]